MLCSLFNVAVDKYEFIDSTGLPKDYQDKHLIGDDGHFVRLHHYPLYRIAELPLKLSDFFVFAFVRNPFDRLVSEYHFLRLNRSMPFNDFVLKLVTMVFDLNKLEEWFSLHLLPQIEFVSLDGEIRCNLIGRFESLDEDYRKVCEALGIDCRPLPQFKKSTRQHYKNYYSAESRAVVENLYRKDLEAFNYEF